MRTRIRHYRKLRQWTQSDLARTVGTTAATVSRLETADMNVSMHWLMRFAEAFDLPVSLLIDEARAANAITCVGKIDRSGTLSPTDVDLEDDVLLEATARNPIAMRIQENIGPYRAGDIIIADRMSSEDVPRALGRDCLVEIDGEAGGFGRFVSSGYGTFLLVPPEPGAEARHLTTPDWVAPVIMLIRQL